MKLNFYEPKWPNSKRISAFLSLILFLSPSIILALYLQPDFPVYIYITIFLGILIGTILVKYSQKYILRYVGFENILIIENENVTLIFNDNKIKTNLSKIKIETHEIVKESSSEKQIILEFENGIKKNISESYIYSLTVFNKIYELMKNNDSKMYNC